MSEMTKTYISFDTAIKLTQIITLRDWIRARLAFAFELETDAQVVANVNESILRAMMYI